MTTLDLLIAIAPLPLGLTAALLAAAALLQPSRRSASFRPDTEIREASQP